MSASIRRLFEDAADSPFFQNQMQTIENELGGSAAVRLAAYVYLGWRSKGSNWFDRSVEWIARQLQEYGYDGNGNYRSEVLEDVWPGNHVTPWPKIWDPKYASLEIISPVLPAGEDGYSFSYTMDTFDPECGFFPKGINYEWLFRNIGSPEEIALNERCRLCGNSGYSSPGDTSLEDAQKFAVVAEVIDVGEVTKMGGMLAWARNPDADLKGKILFTIGDTRTAHELAVEKGASGLLCGKLPEFNMPMADGRLLYPEMVKYELVKNTDAAGPLVFNISPRDVQYLQKLFEKLDEPLLMKAIAIGDFADFSRERPLKTAMAEIVGSEYPDEKVLFMAHVQEPGANDDASGCGLQLEMARAMKSLIEQGILPRPKRSIVFLWGGEGAMSHVWIDRNASLLDKVRAAIAVDMVGEDPEKTFGIFHIEKSPDPSAQTDRKFPGNYLNDICEWVAAYRAGKNDGFRQRVNPYEGGGDHEVFIECELNGQPHPLPAVLLWHRIDCFYHSSLDTMDKISAQEMQTVGAIAATIGMIIASAGECEAMEMMNVILASARWRTDLEKAQSLERLSRTAQSASSPAEIKAALEAQAGGDLELLARWAVWHREALASLRKLCPPALSAQYITREAEASAGLEALIVQADEKIRAFARH